MVPAAATPETDTPGAAVVEAEEQTQTQHQHHAVPAIHDSHTALLPPVVETGWERATSTPPGASGCGPAPDLMRQTAVAVPEHISTQTQPCNASKSSSRYSLATEEAEESGLGAVGGCIALPTP